MSKKTALVIGGSGGIGSEIALRLLQDGFRVTATYHSNKGQIEVNHHEDMAFYEMNLLDGNSINSAIGKICKDSGKIDVVVFSATIQTRNKNILNMQWQDFEEHINLQIKGIFNILQNMKEQIKGKHKTKFIVILTEYCIGKPPSGISDYVTAKYALMGFAKAMAAELAKYNCTFNMVSPGMVDTKLISSLPPKLVEMAAESNPMKRIAMPGDIAKVVSFLSSDDSDYLNGVNIPVNGGGVLL